MAALRWTLVDDGPDRLFEPTRRRVGRGAYAGLEFLEVEAATILNEVPGAPWGFRWSINAYRGCSHACTYCFARPTHEYLGLGIGEDFERRIVVKVNAVDLVRAETDPRRWDGSAVHLGSNTDPYQPAEGRYRLTRGILEVFAERANPVSILTKSPLVLRDADVLADLADRAEVSVAMSLGTLDERAWRLSEPGTPHPRRRLEALLRLRDVGVDVSVLMAPVLPGLSDDPRQIEEVRQACAEAGIRVSGPTRLHLGSPALRAHYLGWLGEAVPEAVAPTERAVPTPTAVRRTRTRPRPAPEGQLRLGV